MSKEPRAYEADEARQAEHKLDLPVEVAAQVTSGSGSVSERISLGYTRPAVKHTEK
jgi:hypothetical protein